MVFLTEWLESLETRSLISTELRLNVARVKLTRSILPRAPARRNCESAQNALAHFRYDGLQQDGAPARDVTAGAHDAVALEFVAWIAAFDELPRFSFCEERVCPMNQLEHTLCGQVN